MRDLIDLDAQEKVAVEGAIASTVIGVLSSFIEKKVTLMDNIEAQTDAIKNKNIELSSELLIVREQPDKVALEVVMMKNDIEALNDVAAKHEEEINSFIELAGVGTIEEVKHTLRVHREIIEKNKVMVEKHTKVQLLQEKMREEVRGLLSCHEDVESWKRRLFYATSEHETAAKRAKKCKPSLKARKWLARRNFLEASTPMGMHRESKSRSSDHHESESEATG
jgi:hypothetical protein